MELFAHPVLHNQEKVTSVNQIKNADGYGGPPPRHGLRCRAFRLFSQSLGDVNQAIASPDLTTIGLH